MDEKNRYYVYAYLREDGTPYYIGKGKNWRAYEANHNVLVPSKDRIVILLNNLTEEQAFANEKDYIAFYGRKNNNTGILRNLTDGGDGMSGYIHTEKTKQLLREIRSKQIFTEEAKENLKRSMKRLSEEYKSGIRKHWAIGRKLTDEHKEKLSKINKGKTISEEQKQLISKSLKGRKHPPEYGKRISEQQKGRKASEAAKANMRIAHKKRWESMSDEERLEIGKKISQAKKSKSI